MKSTASGIEIFSLLHARRRYLLIFGVLFFTLLIFPQPASAQEKVYGPPPLDELVESVKQAVVNLSTTRVITTERLLGPESRLREYFGEEFFEKYFGELPREFRTQALGSGFLIDNQGHILTNNHVIANATEIKVRLQDQEVYDAVVIGTDPKTELALIKIIDEVALPAPARLGDSDAISVGDWVIAMGNPFGLGHTVTHGMISAKGRIIGAGPYDDFLQTDAAINPGNSGGPLYNMSGEVVGINTAIVAEGQGIGFATPINMAKELLPQLKRGRVVRGWLGVVIQDVTPEMAPFFGLAEPQGVVISQVIEGAPAAEAGLRHGDIIVALNGEAVQDSNTFSRRVAELEPGDQVNLAILRDGKRITSAVTIGTMPAETEREQPEPAARREQGAFGFSVRNISPEIAQGIGVDPDEKGVVVIDVQAGSPADEAGLEAADIIKEVNRRPVQNVREFTDAIRQRETPGLLLLILRDEYSLYVTVSPRQQE